MPSIRSPVRPRSPAFPKAPVKSGAFALLAPPSGFLPHPLRFAEARPELADAGSRSKDVDAGRIAANRDRSQGQTPRSTTTCGGPTSQQRYGIRKERQYQERSLEWGRDDDAVAHHAWPRMAGQQVSPATSRLIGTAAVEHSLILEPEIVRERPGDRGRRWHFRGARYGPAD